MLNSSVRARSRSLPKCPNCLRWIAWIGSSRRARSLSPSGVIRPITVRRSLLSRDRQLGLNREFGALPRRSRVLVQSEMEEQRFSVSADSVPLGQGFLGIGVYRPMSFCRCKYTAREEYAPALLKHRLDEKLKNLRLHPEDHVALERCSRRCRFPRAPGAGSNPLHVHEN